MEWVEVTGRTVEEAKDNALDELGVDEREAEFEVLEEPKAGLFGRLRSEARVRARVAPTAVRPKIERRERRKRRERPGDNPGAGGGSRGGGGESGGSGGGQGSESATATVAAGGGGSGRRGEGRGGRRGGGEPKRSTPVEAEGEAMREGGATAEEVSETGEEFVSGLMRAFGVDCQVSSTAVDDETVEIAVEGDGVGLLIGPKGQTLAAIQELARTVVQRKTGDGQHRLVVDVAGYRKARRQALERFTRDIAAQVVASGVARVLEPMPPADRKVVHDTANTMAGVSTTSEGEEPRRRVVISPAPGPD